MHTKTWRGAKAKQEYESRRNFVEAVLEAQINNYVDKSDLISLKRAALAYARYHDPVFIALLDAAKRARNRLATSWDGKADAELLAELRTAVADAELEMR